jgi:hypothetical protein
MIRSSVYAVLLACLPAIRPSWRSAWPRLFSRLRTPSPRVSRGIVRVGCGCLLCVRALAPHRSPLAASIPCIERWRSLRGRASTPLRLGALSVAPKYRRVLAALADSLCGLGVIGVVLRLTFLWVAAIARSVITEVETVDAGFPMGQRFAIGSFGCDFVGRKPLAIHVSPQAVLRLPCCGA